MYERAPMFVCWRRDSQSPVRLLPRVCRGPHQRRPPASGAHGAGGDLNPGRAPMNGRLASVVLDLEEMLQAAAETDHRRIALAAARFAGFVPSGVTVVPWNTP